MKHVYLLVLFFAFMFIAPLSSSAQSWQEDKVVASDGAADDDFGFASAIDGERIVVGARLDDDNGTDAGSVYVYDYNSGTDSWDETKLLASDGTAGDEFGFAVDVDGDRIVVGAAYDGDGSVYVYDYNGGTSSWDETKITPGDAFGDSFGYAVALEGDRIVVGKNADTENGLIAGAAYVYDYNSGTSSWDETKLLASDGANFDQFGVEVGLSGNRIVVGALDDDDNGSNSGSVYIYDYNSGTSSWDETKLTAGDGAGSDNFGSAVSISGDRIAVAATGDDDNGLSSGSIYVYDYNMGLGAWVETKLTASDGASQDNFGRFVKVQGDRMVVGADGDDDVATNAGSAYVFDYNSGTTSWDETKLTASDGAADDAFGSWVGLSGDRIVVGAVGDDDAGSNAGSAYPFEYETLSTGTVALTVDSTNACPGLNNGSIEIFPTGGDAPYTYDWADIGSGPALRTNLAAGTYTVTVTDDNGLTESVSVILETVDLFDSGTSTTPEGCELNGGQIDVVVTADNPPLKYSIDGGANFQNSSTFTNVAPNTYTVTVQDAQGCEITISGVNVAGGTTPISIGSPTVTDVECFGEATGELSMTAGGGTFPYTYTITGPATQSNATGNFTGLLAGTYDIEVVGNNGCRFEDTETIGTNTELTYDLAVTDASCGSSDGEIAISNEAGGQPFGGSTTVIYSEDFNGSTPQVVMNDVTTAPVGPVLPSALASDPSNGTQSQFVINSNYDHPVYPGGPTNNMPDQPAGVTGGPGKTSYMHVAAPATFEGPFYNSTIPLANFSLWSRTVAIDATGLSNVEIKFWWANQYPTANVYIYDGTGWIIQNGTGSFDSGNPGNPSQLEKITTSPPPAGSAEWFEATINNPALTDNQIFYIGFGQDFAPGNAPNPVFQIDDIEVTAAGAGSDYEYTFDGGATWGTTASTTGLTPGTYTVGIRDALGCESLQTVTVGGTSSTVSIDNVTPTDATCTGSDGTITVTASGGTPPLEYSVDGGATYQPSNTFNTLSAGSYDVYVRDAGGCTDAPAFQTTTVGTNTIALTYTESVTDVTCYGDSDGEISLTPTNGTAAYTFSIDNGSTTQASGVFTAWMPAITTSCLPTATVARGPAR